MIWWHERVLRHGMKITHVTVGLHDTSKGWLYECSCGKTWAK
jgi:hypothetical protein